MKSLIISDIHGNLEYTRKIDKICEKENFDKIIILGDFLYNYYYYDEDEEKEIIAILNKRAKITTAVIGNCDRHYELERFNFLVENEIDKIDLDDNSFFITHGHLNNKYAYLIADNYSFQGHTHVYNLDGKHLNPGSVGFPRVNKEHTYIKYEDNNLYLIDIDTGKIIQNKKLK